MNESGSDGSFLIDRVLNGGDRDLQLLAADGIVPLAAPEVTSLQLSLRLSDDPEVSARAHRSLAGTDPRQLCEVVEDADDETLQFLCSELAHPFVVQAILQRATLTGSFLTAISSGLPPDFQELLLLRQEDISRHPEILDHLEKNPQLSRYSRRRIAEYREHLLPRERPAKEEPVEVEPLEDLEVQEAITQASADVAPEGEIDDDTGLTEHQIRSLPVGIRVKLTFGAPRSLRSMLLRDHNPQVAVAALTNGSVSGSQIDELAAQRNVVQEVLTAIAMNPRWVRRYGTLFALVKNPRTPQGLSQRLLPRLSVRDLRSVYNDVGLSQAVRTLARRTFATKTG